MSQRYRATFMPGAEELITKRLQQFPNNEITAQTPSGGSVEFSSSLRTTQLSELRFFTDVFVGEGDGQALPRPGFKTRPLEAGELRPETAHILGLLAGLGQKHAVLDPFAGYGAIARECLQGFHCREVIAVEQNEHLVPHLKSIPHLIAKHGDPARLPHITTHSIDRVISQLPERSPHVLHEVFVQIHRVLRAKGCAALLAPTNFEPGLATQVGFVVEKRYPVLVGGQKMVLLKLRKR